MKNFDDKPIRTPPEDLFGFDPFAKAIAETILKLEEPEGSVIAINGRWGTGKSSIVNLVKHHIIQSNVGNKLKVINFNCWWFRGEDALALEFFRDLYSAIDTAKSERAKDAISQLGSRLLTGSSSFVGAALSLAAPGVGGIAEGGMRFLGELIRQEKTVESLHSEVSKHLRAESGRILIVIDDIDRLSPDEALVVFRLVRSVGRLPNVMYLMAYDRSIAERVVSDRYPSEGPQYLEKIVQAGFDIPDPPQSKLVNWLVGFLNQLWADQSSPDQLHFWNLMHDVVTPEIRSPRDVLRIANTLRVSWEAVSGEVDPVDFLCIEALRVQRPELYITLRSNKGRLTGHVDGRYAENRQNISDLYDRIFLSNLLGEERERVKTGLRRLFPSLDGVWSNMSFSSGFLDEWDRQRRVCSTRHFDTYFRFSMPVGIISTSEIDSIIDKCDDISYLSSVLLDAKKIEDEEGGTRAGSILDELKLHASRIPLAKSTKFLVALFSLHDDLDIEADQAQGFAIGNNSLRIHWIMRALTRGRTTLNERSKMIMEASEFASVGWLVDISWSAYRDYHPRTGGSPEPEEDCITTESDANRLREMALAKIESTSQDGTLINYRGFIGVLYSWSELDSSRGMEKARAWSYEQINNDDALERFAVAFVSSSWSHGAGGFGALADTVAIRRDRVSKGRISELVNAEEFKSRVDALLVKTPKDTPRYAALKRFVDAWDQRDDDL